MAAYSVFGNLVNPYDVTGLGAGMPPPMVSATSPKAPAPVGARPPIQPKGYAGPFKPNVGMPGAAPGLPFGGTVTPESTTQAANPYAGAGAVAMSALPTGTVSNSYGTGGDPQNAGTWVPGRYSGAELYNMMMQLPPEARYTFYISMMGQGQGGNDLQSQAITGFGGLDNLNRWINSEDLNKLGAWWDPSTGQYSVKGPDGAWTTSALKGWNATPYQGTFSAYGGQYGGAASLPGLSGTPAGGTPTVPGVQPPGSAGVQPVQPAGAGGNASLEADASRILGQYMIRKADGSPDWAAMSGTNGQAFWNSLPADVRIAMQGATLGKRMEAQANAGSYGTPAGQDQVYTPPTYAGSVPYTMPERPEYAKTPWDFFNDGGYQFALGEGTKGIENSAAANGSLQSGNTLKALTKFKTGLANQAYGEAFDRYNTDRNFFESQYQTDRNFGRGAYQDDRDTSRRNFESDRNLGYDVFKDARNFDFTFNRDNRDYQTDLDKWNAMFERNAAVDDRNFNYNVDTGDRNFNADILKTLMNSGLSATGGDAQLASLLSSIFGTNTMTGATAGASGTVGQANNIQQLLQLLFASQYAKP